MTSRSGEQSRADGSTDGFPVESRPGLPESLDRATPYSYAVWASPQCDSCRDSLRLIELVPILGPFTRRGRCAGCGRRISISSRLPVIEAATAIVAGFIAYRFGLTPGSAVLLLYCAIFIHLAFVDLAHTLLPNIIVLPAIPLAVALFPFTPLGQEAGVVQAYLSALAGAGAGFGLMLLVFIASRGRLGGGDVKLAALMGAALGFPQIIAGLMLGSVIGGVVALALLALKLKTRSDAIPFGPALVIATIAILVGGSGVYAWYLNSLS